MAAPQPVLYAAQWYTTYQYDRVRRRYCSRTIPLGGVSAYFVYIYYLTRVYNHIK